MVLASGLLFLACSIKKDTLVNRNWHALNTKFNVLYNGNLAFEEGRDELNATYQDNYWEILPIERLTIREEIILDSENKNPNFEIAEEKAAKGIQKHSMDIQDEERNPQTDESFLLLGKTRYFEQRFLPALEAFNYILRKYPKSDKLNEAAIWREKVNIRLENDELAIKNLKKLFKFEVLRDQEYADARAMMAQAYINLTKIDTAVQQLKIAQAYTQKNTEKGRYLYIIGQLYNQLGFKDSANYAFDKVIELKRKSPRELMINAHLQKIQNTKLTSENKTEVLKYLTNLEEDRENRPFLDKIFRQVAEYHLENKKESMALAYFNKSLRVTQNKPQLNALNYENLGEYNFDKNEYKIAGAYYDSTLTNLKENTKKYRAIKKKFDNLEDVINYEKVVTYADSVVSLYNMPKVKQFAYFGEYIAKLKKSDSLAAKKEIARQNKGIDAFAASKAGKQNKGKFYFYNIQSLGYGKTDFKTRWGDRALEDNWRWANKTISSIGIDNATAENAAITSENPEELKYSIDFYLNQIPTDVPTIDSLKTERNLANYQLGLIYKEKFKENFLAAAKLETVLRSNPEERLILPSKYNLYKIYEESGSPLMAEMKQNIIVSHLDSRYAEILLNPQAVLEGDADSPDAKYAQVYKQFTNQDFLGVITNAEENINKHTGDPIVPKFEMLKANAIGRIQGFEAFEEALNYVALNYPNNPEGKKAKEMIADQLPKLAAKDFVVANPTKKMEQWKLVFDFKMTETEKAIALKELLEKAIKDLKYKNSVSIDVFNIENQFLVVHGFISEDFALGFGELIKNNREYRVTKQNFVILSTNYKILQVHKNLQAYKNRVVTPKP
jgi:tetratricopeptide (TPR) repeat protein